MLEALDLESDKAPETDRCPTLADELSEEVGAERSRIRKITEEPAPDTLPSRDLAKENLDDLLGIKADYHGSMIPCQDGQVSIRESADGKLMIDLEMTADTGIKMRGYIEMDKNGGGARITESAVGLNNYFRYRYPNQVQELADELITQVRSAI